MGWKSTNNSDFFYRTQTSLRPNDPNPTTLQNKYISQHSTTIVYEKKVRYKFKVFLTDAGVFYSEDLEPLAIYSFSLWSTGTDTHTNMLTPLII
jgi:hypothetical protein